VRPQVGFSATVRKMRSHNFLLTHLLPARTWCRESHVQYNLNPAQRQRTTISDWTRINARFHPGQSRRNITRNDRSGAANRSCGCLCFNTASCWRRARFSNCRSRRERKKRVARTNTSLNRRSMGPILHRDRLKLVSSAICIAPQPVAICASKSRTRRKITWP
jgi:hypothetical protein